MCPAEYEDSVFATFVAINSTIKMKIYFGCSFLVSPITHGAITIFFTREKNTDTDLE